MNKYFIFILPVIFTCCVNQSNSRKRYSEEQIASLHLDSTTILTAETDSIVNVDLNPFLKAQTFELGTLMKKMKLVPLETTDESLLDDIYKILVTDTHIYIYDDFKGGGIVVFDKEGKFIRRISNGQGPGELIRLYDIDYDSQKNELIAFQHSFFLFFTPDGQFIRREKLPFGFLEFAVIPNGYIFMKVEGQRDEHLGISADYTLLITERDFKLKFVSLPFMSIEINYSGYNYLYSNNNTTMVTRRFADTIYQYINETNQIQARYVLDYSKKKLPQRYLYGTWKEFDAATSKSDYYYYVGEYLETESHNVFVLGNRYTGQQPLIFRDKKSGNLVGGTFGIIDDVNEMPSITWPRTASGNWFISLHYPDPEKKRDYSLYSNSSLISAEDAEKIKHLQDDDNPVLVFYQLKDF